MELSDRQRWKWSRKTKYPLIKLVKRDWQYLVLMLAPVVFYVVFYYTPMVGVIIAFKDYSFSKGLLGSDWIGLKHFVDFYNSYYFWRLIKNTILISVYSILFGFPVPIIFALMLNEIRWSFFRKFAQTVSYIPHFLSTVIVVGMMYNLLALDGGVVNQLLNKLGYESVGFVGSSQWFRTLFVGSGIWASFGFSSIIYLAAISSIDQELYSAIEADGGNRLQKIWHITLPGIRPTIIILLLLSLGGIFSVGLEKIILMYSPINYEVSDVIDSFVYRRGVEQSDFSYATAIGLFTSAVNFILLIVFNYIARKTSETSLW